MTWKKSNDGGLDYDVTQEVKKEIPFNPFTTAYTTSFSLNMEEAEFKPPLSRKEQIKENIKKLRRAKIR